MNIGFIGAGNMGGAIIRGFIKSGKVEPQNIIVNRKNKSALNDMASSLGINAAETASDACKCKVLFLAVKPIMFKSIINEIRDTVKAENPIVVSMAAGLSTENITDMFDFDVRLVRIMPNINAEILMSATSLCKNEFASDKDLNVVKGLLSSIGLATEVPENQFGVFCAIAGCSPAYVYAFIDALARGAQKMGMNKKQALEIAGTAVVGSATMFLNSNEHPQELVDKVCSPGGTTIEGLCTLEEYKFTAGIVKAVENIVEKDRSMNK